MIALLFASYSSGFTNKNSGKTPCARAHVTLNSIPPHFTTLRDITFPCTHTHIIQLSHTHTHTAQFIHAFMMHSAVHEADRHADMQRFARAHMHRTDPSRFYMYARAWPQDRSSRKSRRPDRRWRWGQALRTCPERWMATWRWSSWSSLSTTKTPRSRGHFGGSRSWRGLSGVQGKVSRIAN